MFALLLLPVIVSGYVVCRYHPVHSWRFKRYEGQRLYLEVCMRGLLCLGGGILLMSSSVGVFLLGWVAEQVRVALIAMYPAAVDVKKVLIDRSGYSTFSFIVALSLITPVMGVVWAVVHNAIVDCGRSIKRGRQWGEDRFDDGDVDLLFRVRGRLGNWAAVVLFFRKFRSGTSELANLHELEKLMRSVEDSPLDTFLLRSFLAQHLVQLTLKNDKVYVGVLIAMGEPEGGEAFKEITLLPFMSGYRDKDNKQMYLSNEYPQFFVEYNEDQDRMMDAVYVPRSEVYSFSGFDIEIYNRISGDLQYQGDGSDVTLSPLVNESS